VDVGATPTAESAASPCISHSVAVTAEIDTEPVVGPSYDAPVVGQPAPVPRLVRHRLMLEDGHRVGVAACGEGMPVVLVHGFSAEGILYAQTLARLVKMGLKVIAVDVAGHGATQGLPTGGADVASYAALVGRVLDTLGVERAILAGHSLGGRLVAELAAVEPSRAVAVVLIDAAVGATWDRMIRVSQMAPPVLAALGGLLVADTVTTLPVLRNPTQALKLGRLIAPTLVGHALRPWRLVGPAVSLIRSRPSHDVVLALAGAGVPVVAIHGDRDVVVPHRTAQDAARAAGGWLVTVHGGTHSWLLKDPETLPAIVGELLTGPLGELRDRVLSDAGLDPAAVTPDQIEDVFVPADALVRTLAEPDPDPDLTTARRAHAPRLPRYRWTVQDLGVASAP
jgi:pimeloyl-ACP methyl ester carboxylesterase